MTEPGLQIVWRAFGVFHTSRNRKITNVLVLIL